ncbi:MAG: JAB domain-containing protein [Rhizobiaceae bacterium]
MPRKQAYLKELDIRFKESEYKNILREQIREPNQVYKAVKSLEDATQEKVLGIFVSDDLDEPVFQHIAVGSTDHAFVDLKYLMRQALLTLSNGFILVHNHPKGDPYPSEADREVIQQLRQLAKFHDIQFIDFMVIGKDSYWSLYEEEGQIYQLQSMSDQKHPPRVNDL